MAIHGAYNQSSDSDSQTSLLDASSGDCWSDHGRPAVRSNRQWTSGSCLGFLRYIDAIITQYFHRPVRRRLNVAALKAPQSGAARLQTKESKVVSTETAPEQKTEGTERSETCMTQNDGHFRLQWYVFNFSEQSVLDLSHL